METSYEEDEFEEMEPREGYVPPEGRPPTPEEAAPSGGKVPLKVHPFALEEAGPSGSLEDPPSPEEAGSTSGSSEDPPSPEDAGSTSGSSEDPPSPEEAGSSESSDDPTSPEQAEPNEGNDPQDSAHAVVEEEPGPSTGIVLRENCYCGQGRILRLVELLCAKCRKWYHQTCITCDTGKVVPFITNYVFLCKNCSPAKLESFRKVSTQTSRMCITAIANLQQKSVRAGTNKLFFSRDKEIIPYIMKNWESLTTAPKRLTATLRSTIQKVLTKELYRLFTFQWIPNDKCYGLFCNDLTNIKPDYEDMIARGILKISEMGIQPTTMIGSTSSRKRKPEEEPDVCTPALPIRGFPLVHPFNREGYRYVLAEPDPQAPYLKIIQESPNYTGKPIPGWMYRAMMPKTVLLALHDRSADITVSEDRLKVTGFKGYCTIRATHSVSKGIWYWEATVEDMPERTATRLGWGQDYVRLETPLGSDKFGYSWRSKRGTKFHGAIGLKFTGGYGKGDTLGFLIILPESSITPTTESYKNKPLIKFKTDLYYELKDNFAERLEQLETLEGSKIICFKNGVQQGVAYENIYGGRYYPTISLYKNVTVSVNFGPNFKHAPVSIEYDYKGMCDCVNEAINEQTRADTQFITENRERLTVDSIVFHH